MQVILKEEKSLASISATKLLGEWSGNIKMPNWFFDKIAEKF